ncbi:hypothetical protein [Arthrobacter sp. CJ23]|uniref:hypothetical protein n=1 Tax=Arthrobacter sp. CJ23 TaxID=2972479 RepID=UPI00215CE118|nr:hypothetical protein [Arthrobacter sp. CJ23]UVJ37702.1 hypothetical protein NVV90_10405 [Arthrobacter sp. CJ23]
MNIFNLGGLGPGSQEDGRAPGTPSEALCSRKGCRSGADWQLLWNNPRIHTPERRKVWLACQEHREWLEDYLQTRDLWKDTIPFDATAGADATAGTGGAG